MPWPIAHISVAAAWGSTFFLTKDLLTRMDVADYLALRFLIASVALLLIHPPAIARLSRLDRGRAVALGITYGIAQLVQTEGLRHTSASVSGFVTGMYVVFTPFHRGWSAQPRRAVLPAPDALPAVPAGIAGEQLPTLRALGLGRIGKSNTLPPISSR